MPQGEDILQFSPQYQRFALWQQLVNRYTLADLTYPEKDKLIAISGLARGIGPPSEYVAGLWKHELLEAIRWLVRDVEKGLKPRRASNYRAPSWSWASIDGPVLSPGRTSPKSPINAARLLDVHVELLTDDPYGAIKTAYIRLQASLVSARVTVKSKTITTRPTFRSGFLEDVPIETPQIIYLNYLETAQCSLSLDEREARDGEILHCVPLVMDENHIDGLILTPTNVHGQYTRVGTFRNQTGKRLQSKDDFKFYCKASPIPITPEGYSQYVFTIV